MKALHFIPTILLVAGVSFAYPQPDLTGTELGNGNRTRTTAHCTNTVSGRNYVHGCGNTVSGVGNVVIGNGSVVSGVNNRVCGNGLVVSGVGGNYGCR